ncbi:TetR/AcrR family transcriptional regulator [Microbacterium ulmi]|uniref:TetR family transcriptional regulator n=1 Tax=Microbacterium ulmi TaxID=179095 RepID=A0A7Y2M2P0_9MICO|nr:TetR/AcrR family transcriptional regulator [Microbacterium ulmi]NII69395.1 AcrR family transcriptional regulator [Microbacterium ulmi]NNH03993.1 TetR family transcriptional regulator [Microbacterium ulmi]
MSASPATGSSAGAGARTRLRPDDRRAQLISLGVAALADRELDDISFEEFSARAGVSRALFSHYFGSRQGFHRAVLEAATEAMLAATQPQPHLPPAARLDDTLRRTVEFVRGHGGTFSSMVRGTASGDRQTRELVEAARLAQTARVLDVFDETGVAVSPALRIAVRSWIAFVEQTLVDAALGSDLPTDDIVALAVDCLAGIIDRVQPDAAVALRGS